ncbi:MAG: zinc-dependent alcohol dehydrogenase family protein [Actinobacteria bacterium]|nr:zinc-dependent alcohol dehydrogenase family protein [Actinomycetota bacterium]
MRAMVLRAPGRPLELTELPDPEPGPGQVRIAVGACGVCRTDLHLLDGELPDPKLPVVPGHQVVGAVEALGEGAGRFAVGDRVGVPWLAWACGECRFCLSGRENLCERAEFTGYTRDGGYAELAVADERFCLPAPEGYGDVAFAPLLCAGLIGFRALGMTGEAERLGLFGFGASAHLVCQLAVHEGRRVFALTREGDDRAQGLARQLGAEWAGAVPADPDSARGSAAPPEPLDAAIIFAPAGELVPVALACLERGGVVVCAGIHMSAIPAFPYELLWEERAVRSVANLTRADGEEFVRLAPRVPVRAELQEYSLADAGHALEDLRRGRVRGAAVLNVRDGATGPG